MSARAALLKARLAALDAVEALDSALASLPPDRPPVPVELPISSELIRELKRDEGLRLTAYPDPLSPLGKAIAKGVKRLHGLSGDPWTIGYGHTGPDVSEGLTWTEPQAEIALIEDIAEHNAALLDALPWIAKLDPVRLRALCNMAFNLGIPRLLDFKNTLGALQAKDWNRAAEGALNSLWATQVGDRAKRIAYMFRTGVAP